MKLNHFALFEHCIEKGAERGLLLGTGKHALSPEDNGTVNEITNAIMDEICRFVSFSDD